MVSWYRQKGDAMETTMEAEAEAAEATGAILPPYTMQELEDMSIRVAQKHSAGLQMFTTRTDILREYVEDMAGAFMLGALSATKRLEPGRAGARSLQFLNGRAEMYRARKRIYREYMERDISLSTEIGDGEDGEEINLSDTMEDAKSENPVAVFFGQENANAAEEVIRKFPERTQRILVGRYIDGKTGAQIAQELGISEGRVSQIEKEARETLKRLYNAA